MKSIVTAGDEVFEEYGGKVFIVLATFRVVFSRIVRLVKQRMVVDVKQLDRVLHIEGIIKTLTSFPPHTDTVFRCVFR